MSQIPEEFGYPRRNEGVGRICDLRDGPPSEPSVTLQFRLFHSGSRRLEAFASHEKEVLSLLQPTIVGEILTMSYPNLAANVESRASSFFAELPGHRSDEIFARVDPSSRRDPEVPRLSPHLHQEHEPAGGEHNCTGAFLHRNLLQLCSKYRTATGVEQPLAAPALKGAI